MIFVTSRSKCLPQAEYSTQHQGLFIDKTTISRAKNTAVTPLELHNQITDIGFNQISHPSWIKRDRVLSEVNSIDFLTNNFLEFDTMTKTMDLFSDPHSYTVIPNNIAGFDDPLMTPIIDPDMYYKEKEMACPWISTSTDNLDKEDFIAFEHSPISLSTVLNSPPESVKSNYIYEDESNSICNQSDLMDSEQSFNFTLDEEPYEHKQNYFQSDFHREIDQIANEHKYSMLNDNRQHQQQHHAKTDNENDENDDVYDDDDTPILGNADVMISSPPSASVINSQEEILNETLNNNNLNVANMNQASQSKLLTKRNQCLPQLKFTATVKMMPIQNCNGSTPVAEAAAATEEKPTDNANAVLSTPQLEEAILEMECDFQNFDLVTYITKDNDKSQTTTNKMIEVNSIKQEVENDVSISNIEQILPTPVASPNMKSVQHASNDDEINDEPISPVSSVPPPANERAKRVLKRRAIKKDFDFSDDEFQQPKRPRGRPPKSEPTQLSLSELRRLNPSDRRYYEMRLKNNEASRRSRLNRKGKEEALFDELSHLERINEELTNRDISLDRQLKSWQKKFVKLVQI